MYPLQNLDEVSIQALTADLGIAYFRTRYHSLFPSIDVFYPTASCPSIIYYFIFSVFVRIMYPMAHVSSGDPLPPL